jgi:hypothetical protein
LLVTKWTIGTLYGRVRRELRKITHRPSGACA